MKRYASYIWPVVMIICIEVCKRFPGFIEHYYAQGIYKPIGAAMRFIFGWIPFSVGDLLVAMLILWILSRILIIVRLLIKRENVKPILKRSGLVLIRLSLWMYIGFYLLWGLNYYRLGSSYLLGMLPEPYSTQETEKLVQNIVGKIEALSADSIAIDAGKTNDRKLLGLQARQAFKVAEKQYPFMQVKGESLKPNLLGPLQSYTGYGGYLFPLTGEAHANFYSPSFALPFTVCHEMAHQAGFGTESEANLIGFLAAKASNNRAFQYSAYAGIFQYAIAELYNRDSALARSFIDSLPPYYKRDRAEMRRFIETHENPIQPLLNGMYNLYLLSNNQPEGIDSYNYVVAWLIAFGKKYGWDKI